MKATGVFYLTARPSLTNTVNADGVTRKEWLFPLCERIGGAKGVALLTGFWPLADANDFVQAYAQRLRAGTALTIEFNRVRPDGDRLKCRMATCSLAPERWPVTEINPTTVTTSA